MGDKQKADEIKIGDILVCSWGYEQTNIDFYQIIKLTDKTVTVRQIKSRILEQDSGFGGTVEPIKDMFAGEPFRRKIKSHSNNICIKITDFSSASLWDGKPEHFTSYA